MLNNEPNIIRQLRKEENEETLIEPSLDRIDINEDDSFFKNEKLKAEENRLQSLIKTAEQSTTGVLITDNKDTIRYINE